MIRIAFALSLLSLCMGVAHADEVTIRIDNFVFTPDSVTIKLGDTVTWVNGDDIPHSIIEKNAKFKSLPLDTNDKFSVVIKDAGTIDYFCGFHPHMVGKIIVQP